MRCRRKRRLPVHGRERIPESDYQAGNYWVDVVLAALGAGYDSPDRGVDYAGRGRHRRPVDGTVTATFSEAMIRDVDWSDDGDAAERHSTQVRRSGGIRERRCTLTPSAAAAEHHGATPLRQRRGDRRQGPRRQPSPPTSRGRSPPRRADCPCSIWSTDDDPRSQQQRRGRARTRA